MVGGVLEGNKGWDIGNKVINSIQKLYPGAHPISPKVMVFLVLTLQTNHYLLNKLFSLFPGLVYFSHHYFVFVSLSFKSQITVKFFLLLGDEILTILISVH